MCRSRAVGGRRCPLHSSAGFVGTRLARRASGLDTRQVNATFQVLRQQGHRAEEPTVQQWSDYLQTQIDDAEAGQYSPRTMRAMRAHIVRAADEVPDGPTYHALMHLQERSRAQRQALNDVMDGLSETLGISRTQARRRFASLRAEVDTSRNAPMPAGYSARTFLAARSMGTPLDTPTIHAIGMMTATPVEDTAGEERRVTHQFTPHSRAIASMGYDPSGDQRLEIRFRDSNGNPAERTYAYRHVPQSVWERFQSESPGQVFNECIRGNDYHRYDSVEDEARQATARRCAECGQFAANDHTCPPRREDLDSDTQAILAWIDTLPEDQVMRSRPRDRVIDHPVAPESPTTEESIERVNNAMAEVEAERDQQAALVEHDLPKVEKTEYSIDNLTADLQAVKERIENGGPRVEYMTENATDGLCAPGKIGFGVELEFDTDDPDVVRNIGRRLYEEGLIGSPYQRGYHSGAGEGWTGWSFEADETVAGEIVSPVMYDRPEDWEKLEKVCTIVREEGGFASARTGGHVHVSSGMLGNSITKHAEVVNLVNENEDLLYRVGTNPDASEHRPVYWCAPNHDVDDAYERRHQQWQIGNDPETSKMRHFIDAHGGHNVGVNLAASGVGNASHIEFRQFDGTLDPGTIQTQIKISAAIVAHAAQNAPEGKPQARERRSIGDNVEYVNAYMHENNITDAHHPDVTNLESSDFRKFSTQMFSRPQDRAQLTSVFAATTWQYDLSDEEPYYESDYYDDDDDYWNEEVENSST